MRTLVTLLLLSSLLMSADDIARVESMLNDISQLKSKATQKESKIATCDEKLQKSIDEKSLFEKKEKTYIDKIKDLENQLKLAKKSVKTKEKKKSKTQKKSLSCLKNQKLESDNPFPKLTLKKEFQKEKQEIEFFKAKSFRVNKDADIYDGVDANIVDKWEKRTSFTSNQKYANWIKITGYFVDKKWRPAQKELWIKSSDVTDSRVSK